MNNEVVEHEVLKRILVAVKDYLQADSIETPQSTLIRIVELLEPIAADLE